MQQVSMLILEEYVILISYKMSLFRFNFSKTASDAQVSFLHFFQSEGTWRRLTEQFSKCHLRHLMPW